MKKIFAQCYYTFFINGIMTLMIGVIMPFFMQDYNINYSIAGLFLSLHSLGNLLASFVVSFLNLKLGRKKTVVILSSLIPISFFGIISTQFVPFLAVLFLLTGLGRGGISNTNNAIINDGAVGKASYLNILHTFFAIGAFLTPLVASIMINAGFTWKHIVIVGILLCISMIAVYCSMKIEVVSQNINKVNTVDTYTEKLIPFYKNVNFYLAGGVLFFYMGSETSVNGWLVTYLKNSNIMSVSYAQKLLSAFWAIIILGRLTCAYLSKHIQKTTIILINSCGAALMFLIFLLNKDLPILTFSIVGFGFFFAGIYPTTVSACGNILKGSSAAMGSLFAIAGLGGILAPYIIGFVANAINISSAMYVIMTFIIFTIVFSTLLKLRLKE